MRISSRRGGGRIGAATHGIVVAVSIVVISVACAATGCDDSVDVADGSAGQGAAAGQGSGGGGSGVGGSGGNAGQGGAGGGASSGLEWQDGHADTVSWAQAIAYCDDLTEGGHEDWRLPTIDELRSLVVGCSATEPGGSCGVTDECTASACAAASSCGCANYLGPGPSGCYTDAADPSPCMLLWSAVSVSDSPEEAWTLDFPGARVGAMPKEQTPAGYCVRDP